MKKVETHYKRLAVKLVKYLKRQPDLDKQYWFNSK